MPKAEAKTQPTKARKDCHHVQKEEERGVSQTELIRVEVNELPLRALLSTHVEQKETQQEGNQQIATNSNRGVLHGFAVLDGRRSNPIGAGIRMTPSAQIRRRGLL